MTTVESSKAYYFRLSETAMISDEKLRGMCDLFDKKMTSFEELDKISQKTGKLKQEAQEAFQEYKMAVELSAKSWKNLELFRENVSQFDRQEESRLDFFTKQIETFESGARQFYAEAPDSKREAKGNGDQEEKALKSILEMGKEKAKGLRILQKDFEFPVVIVRYEEFKRDAFIASK